MNLYINRHLKPFLLAATVLLFSNCNLEDININPNDPVDVPLNTLLPPSQLSLAEVIAENAAVISGIFMQYFVGVDNQAVPIERYVVDESFNMNPIWADFYTTTMTTLNIIIEKAGEQNSPHYSGLAKVLMAKALGTVTSLWGDVPFSEAFRGSQNLSPVFEPQQSLYQTIQSLLDQAIAELSVPSSDMSPGTDDVYWNGDLDKWIKAAYALKARYYLHLVKKDPDAASKALSALENGFEGSADDLEYTFGISGEENPWFQYFRNTPYIRIDPSFIGLITDDLREDFYFRRSFGEYKVGPYYASTDSPVPLITYYESKFMEAEALVRTGSPDAETALKEAIITNIKKVTDDEFTMAEIQAYADENGTLTGDMASDLEIVMNEKYKAMYTQTEAWSDFRRTGFPELTPNSNGDHPQNPGGFIPRRLPYPQNERLYNTNFPASVPNLQDRFWWDQ